MEQDKELLEQAKEYYYNQNYDEAAKIFQKISDNALLTNTFNNVSEMTHIYIAFLIMRGSSLELLIDDNTLENNVNHIEMCLTRIKNSFDKENREYIDIIFNIYKEFYEILKARYSDVENYYTNMSNNYVDFAHKLTDIMQQAQYTNTYYGTTYNLIQQKRVELDNFKKEVDLANKDYVILVRKIIMANCELVAYIMQTVEDYSLISSTEIQGIYDKSLEIYKRDSSDGIYTEDIKETMKAILFALKGKKNTAKHYEIERYWEDKPGRKKELEDMKDKIYDEKFELKGNVISLEEEIKELEQNINQPLKEDELKKELEDEQKELINQKNSLGIFKRKEKDLLQKKIDEKQVEIDAFYYKITDERKKLKEQYQPTIDEKNREIQKLKEKINLLETKDKIINKELYLEED